MMMSSKIPGLGNSDLRLLIRLRGKIVGTVGCYRGKAGDAALASTKAGIGVLTQQLEDGHSCERPNSAEMEFKMAKSFDTIPGPKGLPYFGTLFEYKFGPLKYDRYHEVLVSRYRKYGKIFKETLNGRTTVHLFDPDFIQQMNHSEAKQPHREPLMATSKIFRRYSGLPPGLGNLNGSEWYRLRSAVQHSMFDSKMVQTFTPVVSQIADEFVERIRRIRDPATGKVEDFLDEAARWNMETSAMITFETRLGSFEAGRDSWHQKMFEANLDMFRLAAQLRFSLPFYRLFSSSAWKSLDDVIDCSLIRRLFPLQKWKKLSECEGFLISNAMQLADQACKKRMELEEKGELGKDRYSLLSHLLQRKDLSYQEVLFLGASPFMDGPTATGVTLVNILYCLATNPEKQNMLYKEIADNAPNTGTHLCSSQNYPYLKACIKEGLRLFPSNTHVSRIPQKNMVIGGYQIPAGTRIEFNGNMMGRMLEYFDDPDSYRPERWIRGLGAQHVHPCLLLPFGRGARTCPGMRLVQQDLRVVLIKLLDQFTVDWPNKDEKLGQTYSVLFQPNIRSPTFRFTPRNQFERLTC